MRTLKKSAHAIQEALSNAGLECQVKELPSSARTAKEAARAIGCTVAEIAKSIVFIASASSHPLLVIASGVNRIDEKRIAHHLHQEVQIATPEFVRRTTGYAIGGVPPCAHAREMEIFIDKDLLELREIWAAAGTPNAVFHITPEELVKLTEAKIIAVN